MTTSIISNLRKVQEDLSKLKSDDSEIKSFLDKFRDFQKYLKINNLDIEYFDIFSYDEIKYYQLILSKGDLVFRVIDDLACNNLSDNLDWRREHYFLDFESLELKKVCEETLDHNLTPFNIHACPTGFYLESWCVSNIINYIANTKNEFLFLPLYLDNYEDEYLHATLIIIEIKNRKIYYWDCNGEYSVFYNNKSKLDTIPAMMEILVSSFFQQDEFIKSGYNFAYIQQSDIQLYKFNVPHQKYDFDNGDCFIHMLLIPYLITKLNSLDNLVKFYKNMNKEYQSFLIYNFSSYLTTKYDHLIEKKQKAIDYINKHEHKHENENPDVRELDIKSIVINLENIMMDLRDNIPYKNDLIYCRLINFEEEINKLKSLKV
jgi:hypothetical protein